MLLNKICNKCHIEKSVTEFWRLYKKDIIFKSNVSGKSQYAPICKPCQMVYKNNPKYRAKSNQTVLKYYKRVKLEVFNHYCNGDIKCFCCGEKHLEFLTINHINGGGNIKRRATKRAGVVFYAHLKALKYPNGYNVLCYNCNCSIGNHGYCPHKKVGTNINPT